MKKILFLFLMTFVSVQSAQIPLIDLTGPSAKADAQENPAITEEVLLSEGAEEASESNHQEIKIAQDISLREKTPQTAEKVLATQQAAAPASAASRILSQSRRLRLFLRELSVIQQAAKKAGGDIRVTIEPVGITPDELVAPLAEMGWFDIKYGQDAIVVRSKSEDPYTVKLRDEVAQLEQQRKSLASDVHSLEKLSSEWQARIRSYSNYQPSAAVQNRPQQQQQTYYTQQQYSSVQQQQQQQLPLQQQPGYQPTPKTVYVAAQPPTQNNMQSYPQQAMIPAGYENQRVMIPQPRQPMYPQQQMTEQPVPRTLQPGVRDLPASAPLPVTSSNNNNDNFENQRYSSAMPRQMPQPMASVASQPQYPESTVVLAPRANW